MSLPVSRKPERLTVLLRRVDAALLRRASREIGIPCGALLSQFVESALAEYRVKKINERESAKLKAIPEFIARPDTRGHRTFCKARDGFSVRAKILAQQRRRVELLRSRVIEHVQKIEGERPSR